MIPMFKVFMAKEVDGPLIETIHSGWIGQGPRVAEFEKALSDRIGNPNCLTLSAGTHGLHLALRLADVSVGDSVVCTPLTCTASNWPVLYQGADIVWADVQPDSLNIDPASVRKRITGRTKAIICVHWGGYSCDLQELGEIAQEHGIALIEDAAHAFGATYRDTTIGDCSHSDYCVFSFQAIKHLTCSDGGALFTRERSDYDIGKLLRWFGIDREGLRRDMRCESDIGAWGYKYHLNDVCATIGLANLPHVDGNLVIARANASYYRRELGEFPGITLLQNGTDRQSSYWMFTMLVEDRSGFSRMMGEKGVMVSRVHERNDKHSCVSRFKTNGLENLESAIHGMIAMPVGWWVSKEDREYIVSSIKEGW